MVNILNLIYLALTWILWLYSLLIVIDAIMSWLPMLSNSIVGRFLDKVVNPYLNLFRKLIQLELMSRQLLLYLSYISFKTMF